MTFEKRERKIHPRVAQVSQEDAGILQTFNMSVIHAWEGVCQLECTVPPSLVNAAGFGHGAIAYALLDTACAYALGTLELRGVTTHGDINYVAGSQAGSELHAEVQVLSHSKRVATLRGEVYLGQRQLAAHGSFVFQLKPSA